MKFSLMLLQRPTQEILMVKWSEAKVLELRREELMALAVDGDLQARA